METALYTEDIKIYIFDGKNNKKIITNPNAIDFRGDTIFNYVRYRDGRYYFDFLIDYKWQLKSFRNYDNTIFNVHAYIKLVNFNIQAKLSSIQQEFISPFDIGISNNLYIGDITNDGITDIGFEGGFLEKRENNKRFLLKYSFSYYFDSDSDLQLDGEEKIIFAEFIADVKFESNKLVNYLFDDYTIPFKKLILGNEIILNLTTNRNVDKVELFVPSLDLKIGEFLKVSGTNDRFVYNWTNIQNLLSPYYESGNEIDIIIKVFDSRLNLNDSLEIKCLLDFEAPEINITIGDGSTDYSLGDYATPWTSYEIEIQDNLDNIISPIDCYYSENPRTVFRVLVFNVSNNQIYKSNLFPLENQIGTLSELNIPFIDYQNPEKYYYKIKLTTYDAASNNISSFSDDLFISNELSIEFGNKIVDVNDLYNHNENYLNFTISDIEGNLIKNQLLSLKSNNYDLKNPVWDDTNQSYLVKFDNILDLIPRSDNIFDGTVFTNYHPEGTLNWDIKKEDTYVFSKHASQKDPLLIEFLLQQEKTVILNLSDTNSFYFADLINPKELYCYIWNNKTERYDIKREFDSDDYIVDENGTISLGPEIDFNSIQIADNLIFFSYYGSEFANLIKDTQKNGIFFKVLIPNIYSTHCTIDELRIDFHDLKDNSFQYSMDYLTFDKYFQNVEDYVKIIPGMGELLEIPIYIDLAKLSITDLPTQFDISQIHAITFSIYDAPIWPGNVAEINSDYAYASLNYPYQTFGISEISFYDIVSDKTNFTLSLEDLDFGYNIKQFQLSIDKLNSTITDLEVYNDKNLLTSDQLNQVHFADTIDVYFQINHNNDQNPLYKLSTPLISLIDKLTNTLLGLSLIEWDNSIKKYHCKFTIVEDIKEDGAEDYRLQFIFH